jgi:hypothetical protein
MLHNLASFFCLNNNSSEAIWAMCSLDAHYLGMKYTTVAYSVRTDSKVDEIFQVNNW